MPKQYGTPGTRLLSPDCCTSQSLAACSVEAQLLFDRLVVQADDQGRLQADPHTLKAACFPLVSAMTPRKITRFLTELESNGMLIAYKSGRVGVIQLTNWWTFQGGMRRAYPSRWASPEGWTDRVYGFPARPTGQDDAQNGAGPPAARPQSAETLPAHRPQPARKSPAHRGQSAPLTRGVPEVVPEVVPEDSKVVPPLRGRETRREPGSAHVPPANGDERESDIARARARLADPKASKSIREAAIARLQQLGAPLEPEVDFGEAPV